jgi:hypothetical protein
MFYCGDCIYSKGRAEKQLFACGIRQPAREKAPRIKKKGRLLSTLGAVAEGGMMTM